MKYSTMTVVALVLMMAVAVPASAASFCVGVCVQASPKVDPAEPDVNTATQSNVNTQTCAGNVQIGVSAGDQQQCQQTNYQCGAAANGNVDGDCRNGTGGAVDIRQAPADDDQDAAESSEDIEATRDD